jgi:hypothetical protein
MIRIMETLKQLSKKYTSLSLGTLVALLLMTGVTSCNSCNKTADDTGKIEISTTKPSLQGPDKDGEVDFKLAAGEESRIAKFEGYRVKIKVTGPGKIKINGTSIEVKEGEEADYKLYEVLGAKEDGGLEGEDKQTMKFTFEPTAGTMTATFQLIDKEDKEVGDVVKVDWIETATLNVQAAFTVPADDATIFTADKEYEFTLKNKEDEVESDDLLVKLTSSDGDVTFTLGGKNDVDATGKSLTYVAGKQKLGKGDESKFKIQKNTVANAKTTSKATVVVEYKGVEIAKREITWKAKDIRFVFRAPAADNKVFVDNSDCGIELHNTGLSTVKPSAITVGVTTEHGTTFTIGSKDDVGTGANITLQDILGNDTDIANGGKPTFNIKIKGDNSAKESKVTLEIKSGADVLATRVVTWKAKDIRFVFNVPAADNKVFVDNSDCGIELHNTGLSTVKPSAITVGVTTEHGTTFTIGKKDDVGTGTNITLQDILGNDTDIANGGKPTFNIKIKGDNSAKESKVTLEIKSGADVLGTRVVTWKAKDVKFVVIRPADDKKIFVGADACAIELKNSGLSTVTPSAITVGVTTEHGTTFTIGSKDDVGTGVAITLQDILGNNTDLVKDASAPFNIKIKGDSGAEESKVTLEIKDGTTVLATREVTWKAKDVKLKVTLPADDAKIFIGADACGIELQNIGLSKLKPSELTFRVAITNGATFKLGSKDDVKNGDDVSLADILGKDDEIVRYAKNPFNIKIKAANGVKESKVTLEIKSGADVLATRVVTWKSELENIKFTKPVDDTQTFLGSNPFQVELENEGREVSLDDITVLVLCPTGFTFKLGNVDFVNNTTKTLTEILGGAGAVTLPKTDKKPFDLKLEANTSGKVTAKITLIVKYKGVLQALAKRIIVWNQ